MQGLFASHGPKLAPWYWRDLRPHYYNRIAIDCPWDFENYSEKGEAKGPRAQYETMSLDEIRRLPVWELADVNCLLLHWVPAPLILEATRVPNDWGFTVRSFFHWRKVFPSGRPAMGCGYRVRSMGELCIVATKGEPKHKPFPGDFAGVRRSHSQKPEEFYQLIDRCCLRLKRRADVFGRQSRPGWDVFGNEATKFGTELAA